MLNGRPPHIYPNFGTVGTSSVFFINMYADATATTIKIDVLGKFIIFYMFNLV